MSRRFTKELTAEWLEEMRNDLKPGDTLHTIVRHRAASGMSRHIDVYRFTCEGGKVVKHWLSPRIAAVCGFTFDEKKESIRISGGGMDMAEHVVYSLGRALWPDGFGVWGESEHNGKKRASTRENAAQLVADGVKFYGRNGDTSGWDNDGGFALKSERI